MPGVITEMIPMLIYWSCLIRKKSQESMKREFNILCMNLKQELLLVLWFFPKKIGKPGTELHLFMKMF